MDGSRDRHAIFDFLIDDAVPADDYGATFFHFVGAAAQNLAKNLDVYSPLRKANNVHAGLRFTTHGIDIAQRISSGDLAENIRVIDDGSEKIDGVDDGEVGTKPIDPRVVGGFGSDQHIGIVKLRQAVQDLHEVGGAELGGSTRGLDLLRQPNGFIFAELHRIRL